MKSYQDIQKYVINLDRSKDRRERFDRYNMNYLNYKYITGIDGKLLDRTTIPTSQISKDNCTFSDGSMGCALSHLKLWEKCIELNKPILVMEDDVVVNVNFNLYVDQIMNMVPSDFDIIQLWYNLNSCLSYQITSYERCISIFSDTKPSYDDIEINRKTEIYPSVAKLNHSFGLSCYIISPKGAKILRDYCFPLYDKLIHIPVRGRIKSCSIDCIMNSIYSSIKGYVSLFPIVIVPHGCSYNKSTIDTT
jgi:glycosyl transferase, family 25